jgi:hypothetical protein
MRRCETNQSLRSKKKVRKFQLYLSMESLFTSRVRDWNLETFLPWPNTEGIHFRTWRTNNGQRSGKEVLDEAWEHGLYVTMGLDVERERHGFDYDDKAAVAVATRKIKS